MRGGGYFSNVNTYPVNSNRPYMVWVEGGNVDISNSVLKDVRRPGGVVRMYNGTLVLKDSMVGWVEPYEKIYHNESWYEHGITMIGNSNVRVENTVFKNLDYIVHNSHNLGTFSYDRMNLDHVSEMYGMMSWAGWTLPHNLITWE